MATLADPLATTRYGSSIPTGSGRTPLTPFGVTRKPNSRLITWPARACSTPQVTHGHRTKWKSSNSQENSGASAGRNQPPRLSQPTAANAITPGTILIIRNGPRGTRTQGSPVSTATTVRVRNGRTATTDGPFAETKEQLGGFYLIEARDLNDAIQVAARIPSARLGSIEVRPIMEFDRP